MGKIRDKIWMDNLNELKNFVDNNGHTVVPFKTPLGKWLQRQRLNWDKLSTERKAKLEAIHPNVNQFKETQSFQKYLDQLIEFRELNGNTNIPHNDEKYKELYQWLQRQYRNNKEYSSVKNNWTVKRRKEFKNRRLRLQQAAGINFSKNDKTASEDFVRETLRLIDQWEKHTDEDFTPLLTAHKNLNQIRVKKEKDMDEQISKTVHPIEISAKEELEDAVQRDEYKESFLEMS